MLNLVPYIFTVARLKCGNYISDRYLVMMGTLWDFTDFCKNRIHQIPPGSRVFLKTSSQSVEKVKMSLSHRLFFQEVPSRINKYFSSKYRSSALNSCQHSLPMVRKTRIWRFFCTLCTADIPQCWGKTECPFFPRTPPDILLMGYNVYIQTLTARNRNRGSVDNRSVTWQRNARFWRHKRYARVIRSW